MVGQIPNHLAASVFLFGCFSHVLEVGGMEEEMPVQLIAAGVALPIPATIGALGPAGFVNFPKSVALGLFAIAIDPTRIGIRQLHRSDGSGHIAFGWRRGSTLSHLLEETQGLKSPRGPGFCLGVTGRRIGKALAGPVHRGPQTVIVGVIGSGCRPIGRSLQWGFGRESIRGATDILIHLALIVLSLLGEGHRLLVDEAHTVGRGEPSAAIGLDPGLGHRIGRQPTRSLTVLKLGAVPANYSTGRGEPDLTRRTCGDPSKLIPRQSVFALKKTPPLGRPATHPGLAGKPELA